jgi:hypothetical protein
MFIKICSDYITKRFIEFFNLNMDLGVIVKEIFDQNISNNKKIQSYIILIHQTPEKSHTLR